MKKCLKRLQTEGEELARGDGDGRVKKPDHPKPETALGSHPGDDEDHHHHNDQDRKDDDDDDDFPGEGVNGDQAVCEQLTRGQEEVLERETTEGNHVLIIFSGQ